eukprot:746317-Hanusia_phi.AAC.9
MYSLWHNSLLDSDANLLGGYLRSSHDIFHLPENHFKCSLFPHIQNTLASNEEPTKIIIEGLDNGSSALVDEDYTTIDIEPIMHEPSADDLTIQEPDWCNKLLDEAEEKVNDYIRYRDPEDDILQFHLDEVNQPMLDGMIQDEPSEIKPDTKFSVERQEKKSRRSRGGKYSI